MRIVYVIGTSTGGVGTHVRALARDVAAAGHEVGVIGPAQTDEHFGFSALPGVRFAALDVGTGVDLRDTVLVTRLRRILRGFGPDIVHAHGFRAGLIAHLATRLLRPRPTFIESLHNQASGTGIRGSVETGIERLLARGADLTLAASTDLVVRAHDLGARDARFSPAAAPAIREVGAAEARATRAALAAEYDFSEDAVIVLAVGRVAPQKNYGMLVRALARLGHPAAPTDAADPADAAAPREIVVLVAGAADEAVLADIRAQYAEAATASALPALHFLGARDDVAALLAAADVYVLTSVWEARALVLQEALMTGQAIVATATGGTPELVGDSGVLIDSDDDESLADAIGTLAENPALRAELGERAKARGRELPDEGDVAAELLAVYAETQPSPRD
ncbi:glycosyltransferase family 4 protein [Brevibacterium casei]|uniref:glycosyltransferase family 4 protein n=1 Tax=Brevibacterium casei TaxID=33889 RepID=UPI00186B9642|nr:glycosyltransferase family 4 protein [Brevibacterium casei]MBE4695902.1 glycosyltransferase family 4 protein [Brevibacterium casei]MBY3579024.1 glycosyltransferase family 4 protein [Brevibacterium casei]